MKRLVFVPALASLLVLALLAPSVEARPHGSRHHRHHGGFGAGFAAGYATGLLFRPLAAPGYYSPRPYYPSPYYPPPGDYAPSCSQAYTPGYWASVPIVDASGYTAYQYQWVPDAYPTVCR